VTLALRLVEATPAERRFRARVRALIRGLDSTEVAALRRIAQRTRALRAEILAGLADEVSWSSFHLPRILDEIDRALLRWDGDLAQAAGDASVAGLEAGAEVGVAFSTAAGAGEVGRGVLSVSSDLIDAVRATSAELVTNVRTAVRTRIAREVRGATLGLQRPFEAMRAVSKVVPATRMKGRLVGPMARAEVIVRTETNRAFSIAQQKAAERLADTVPEMLREWVATNDSRTRPSHRRAHGQIRAVDKPFLVGGASLMHPRDMSGPAREVIQCRCLALPKMPEWDAAPSLDRK
tara:strand:- start:3828 stop:4706 length:879 start_codon:yes stop_codon:yes gene_type:complete